MRSLFVFILIIIGLSSCQKPSSPMELLLTNARIYSVDSANTIYQYVGIQGDRIEILGQDNNYEAYIGDSTTVLDLKGAYVYPGFIEGHAHIMGVGDNLINVDLMYAKNYDEVIQMVQQRAAGLPEGTWILGRGWHQEKWETLPESMFNGFPTHDALSKAVPNHPVYLKHASGHAALANAKAMELAGISSATPNPDGGEIFKTVGGQATGLFNERAQAIITMAIPDADPQVNRRKLELAIEACVENGLTGFHQAGSGQTDIDLFSDFAASDDLKLRLHVMLRGNDSLLLKKYFAMGPQQGLYNDHLNIRSVKLYADGALGSRGAWLLEEYSDAPGVHGHNVTPLSEISQVVEAALDAGFQACTHAIGDRANREVLNIYEQVLSKSPEKATDHRFRIEHAQHFHPEDLPRVVALGVVPAMQAIHMASDRPWAIDRLGKERIEGGAYMWHTLIASGAKIVNGTDAPVEPINPLASYYASVSRKTLSGTPDGGYEPVEKMSRLEALKSYTIWAAYGAFMEDVVGTIEKGKYADFTILDKDLLEIPEEEILQTKVAMTIIGGEVVYSAK